MGFGFTSLLFGAPIQLGGGTSSNDIATQLLKRERAAGGQADQASCQPRQASDSEFLCTVLYGGLLSPEPREFLATVHNDDSVTFRHHGV